MGLFPSKNRVRLVVLGWIRLFINDKVKNIPIEIKLVCKEFFGALIDSKIFKMNEEHLLLTFIKEQTKQNWNWKLIYRGTEHGFKKEDFYEHCRDIGNTVVIVHSDSDQVFGGYTPCKWTYDENGGRYKSTWGADESLTSFLFILRTCKGSNFEPRLFKLKESAKEKAVCHVNNSGFDFGCNDFYLYSGKVWNHHVNCCYEWYDTIDTSERFTLCGTAWEVEPTEIEIYQLY